LKHDGTRAETIFRLSTKGTSPFKSAGESVQSTTGSRGVRNSGTNGGYTMFRGSVRGTSYPLHSLVSPSLSLPFGTVCHHISAGVYFISGSSFFPAVRLVGCSGLSSRSDFEILLVGIVLCCQGIAVRVIVP